MPDITMCKGTAADICKQCYRKNAEPNLFRQAYFIDLPIKFYKGLYKCDELYRKK